MRCVCLLQGPARPFILVIPAHATPSYNLRAPSSASLPRRRRLNSLLNDDDDDVPSGQQVGELGHTLIATLQSDPAVPIPKSQQQRKQEAQISGSDVLWALQRASARNRKKKTNNNNKQELRRASYSVAAPREESAVDYTNVRPLHINPHWAAKLDELEKRLRELSDAV